MRRRPMRRGRPVARRGRSVNKRRGRVNRRTRARQQGSHTHNVPNHDHWNQAQTYITDTYTGPVMNSVGNPTAMNMPHSHTLQGGDARTSGAYGNQSSYNGGSGYNTTSAGTHQHPTGLPRPRGRGRGQGHRHPARRKPNKLRG